ncbi:MAG TPA: cysteine peptidase family C39 domain-containing protein [Pirellulaceae bacterium]|nr:cysteine peptidase family C39 domain-containing protein [Pirellulaceae bacterium]
MCLVLWFHGSYCSGADHPQPQSSWSQPGRCGVNCLYAMLRLAGRDVTYSELCSTVPSDQTRGSNLADLESAAKRYGVSAHTRKVSTSKIPELVPPFILHMELADVSGSGHFVTVYNMRYVPETKRYVLFYIDGGNATMTQAPLPVLSKTLTGYVLVDASRQSTSLFNLSAYSYLSLTLVSVVVGLVVGGGVARFRFSGSHRAARGA